MFLAPGTSSMEDKMGWQGGFRMIQARYIYVHFISVITSTPPQIIEHQILI